jgi:hypothetical protein
MKTISRRIFARYQDFEALFTLDGELYKGDFPQKKLKMVSVWAEIHSEELFADRQLLSEKAELYKIDPLR